MPWQIGPIPCVMASRIVGCPRLLGNCDPGWELGSWHPQLIGPLARQNLDGIGRCHGPKRVVHRDCVLAGGNVDPCVAHVDAFGILGTQYAGDLVGAISTHIESGVGTVWSHDSPANELESNIVSNQHDCGESDPNKEEDDHHPDHHQG